MYPSKQTRNSRIHQDTLPSNKVWQAIKNGCQRSLDILTYIVPKLWREIFFFMTKTVKLFEWQQEWLIYVRTTLMRIYC